MERLLLILVIAIGIHVAVVFLLVANHLELRTRYVVWWIAGAAALALRAIVETLTLSAPPFVPLLVVGSALLLAGAGFFLTGSAARDPRLKGIVLWGLLGFGALVFAAVVLLLGQGDVETARLVSGLAAGAAFLIAAEGYRRGERVLDDAATRLIFGGLLAAGINLIGWAWVRRTPGVIAFSEFLGALSILAFGTGIELRALQRARQLVVLGQISAVLHRSWQLKELLDNVLERTADLLQVHSGWMFLRDPATGDYEVAAAHGLPGALEEDRRAGMGGSCRCLELLQNNELTQPVNIIDCLRMERAGLRTQHASVPLRSATGFVGLLNLVLPGGRVFSQRELALLATVGSEVGLAIEKTRLLEELRDKERVRSDLLNRLLTAHEDERRRIARELHDEAGQSLTALILNIERLRAVVEQGQAATEGELERLQGLAETTLEEVRKLIYDLRPTVLDDFGLAAAIRWYAQNQLEPRGLTVDLTFQLGEARLDPVLETAVFRIAQEALWNVVKHAGATRVEVALVRDGGRVVLRVKDNGRGFQTDASRPFDPLRRGLGLGGIQERAGLLGGSVRVTSATDAGTEIVAEFPLPAAPPPPRKDAPAGQAVPGDTPGPAAGDIRH